MIADLAKEEAEDLSKKEYCEKERSEKTQTAKMTSVTPRLLFCKD